MIFYKFAIIQCSEWFTYYAPLGDFSGYNNQYGPFLLIRLDRAGLYYGEVKALYRRWSSAAADDGSHGMAQMGVAHYLSLDGFWMTGGAPMTKRKPMETP